MRDTMLSTHEVARRIEDAVQKRKAFSFVRLGDGEGCVFGHPGSFLEEDRNYFTTHFGETCTAAVVQQVQGNLKAAIADADLVGVRDDVILADESAVLLDEQAIDFLERFRSLVPLRRVEIDIDLYAAKRVFRLLRWFRESGLSSERVCSQWVCYDLARIGFWEKLLRFCGPVAVIHCSPHLPDKLQEALGVKVESILVPDKAVHQRRWHKTGGQIAAHFPAIYQSVCGLLQGPLNGKVFLVGAGLVGKGYLKVIKDNGGIALDLGALLDAWDGRATRHLVYRDKVPAWQSSEQPPCEFLFGQKRGD